MGAFLGASLATAILAASDERACDPRQQWNAPGRHAASPWADGELWPASRGMGQSISGGSTYGDASSDSGSYDNYRGNDDTGGAQVKKLIGLSLDASGNALGSCVVRGYLTTGDTLVGIVTTDAGGYYELPTIYLGAAHYVTMYKSGSPDVSGTSVNTLIPV